MFFSHYLVIDNKYIQTKKKNHKGVSNFKLNVKHIFLVKPIISPIRFRLCHSVALVDLIV